MSGRPDGPDGPDGSPRRTAALAGMTAGLLALSAASAAHGTVLHALGAGELDRLADDVVVADVVDARAAWDARHEVIETTVTVRVVETRKGAAVPGARLTVRQLGGSAEGVTMVVPGAATFAIGERALLHLRGRDPTQPLALVGMAQGKQALGPPPVLGYGRVTTSAGQPYRWAESCITMVPALGAPEGLTEAELHVAEWTSALSWSEPSVPCTYLHLTVAPPSSQAGRIKADGRNSLVFRTDKWCRDPPPDDGGCYDPAALALTSFFARDSDGRIFDADIEFNAVDFKWAILDGPTDARRSSRQDVVNTLTHELGHVIGLDHNCYAGGMRPRGNDQDGAPLPDCGRAPAAVRAATMFFSAPVGEIAKRSLEADDIAAVCASYPIEEDPKRCEKPTLPGRGACAVDEPRGSDGPPWVAVAAITILGAALVVRRRRRLPAPLN